MPRPEGRASRPAARAAGEHSVDVVDHEAEAVAAVVRPWPRFSLYDEELVAPDDESTACRAAQAGTRPGESSALGVDVA